MDSGLDSREKGLRRVNPLRRARRVNQFKRVAVCSFPDWSQGPNGQWPAHVPALRLRGRWRFCGYQLGPGAFNKATNGTRAAPSVSRKKGPAEAGQGRKRIKMENAHQ
jgi:hypothetical protein